MAIGEKIPYMQAIAIHFFQLKIKDFFSIRHRETLKKSVVGIPIFKEYNENIIDRSQAVTLVHKRFRTHRRAGYPWATPVQ